MTKTVNGITYEVKAPKAKTREEIQKRSDEKAMFAYEIAKKICEFAETNVEVKDILSQVQCVFLWYQEGKKPEIYKNPITSGGLEMIAKAPHTEGGAPREN